MTLLDRRVTLESVRCPCGNPLAYASCCGPFIRGWEQPSTAEQLMRSRYSAYALSEIDYLIATHDPAHPPAREGIERWAREAEFTSLEIRGTEQGSLEDVAGVVEFVAHYREGGADRVHHERSRFERIGGRWFYFEGPAPVRKRSVGRNEPCPCGSGKKSKRCCAA